MLIKKSLVKTRDFLKYLQLDKFVIYFYHMTIIKKAYNLFKKSNNKTAPEEKTDKNREILEKKVLEGANKAVQDYKGALKILEDRDKA